MPTWEPLLTDMSVIGIPAVLARNMTVARWGVSFIVTVPLFMTSVSRLSKGCSIRIPAVLAACLIVLARSL